MISETNHFALSVGTSSFLVTLDRCGSPISAAISAVFCSAYGRGETHPQRKNHKLDLQIDSTKWASTWSVNQKRRKWNMGHDPIKTYTCTQFRRCLKLRRYLSTRASLLVTNALLLVARSYWEHLGALCIATSNKCLTSSNKKLLGTSASLLVTSARAAHWSQLGCARAKGRDGGLRGLRHCRVAAGYAHLAEASETGRLCVAYE